MQLAGRQRSNAAMQNISHTTPSTHVPAGLEDGLLASGGFNLYLKKHMLKGEAVPLALLSLVTMTLLSFLIWRLWGCLCCCFSRTRKRQVPVQFELSKPWLRFWRWMAVVCALASVAMCAASMIKFPKHILSHPKQRVDAALVFGGGVLDAADAAAAQVQAIVPALGAIRGVLDVDVNASSIKAAIQVGVGSAGREHAGSGPAYLQS